MLDQRADAALLAGHAECGRRRNDEFGNDDNAVAADLGADPGGGDVAGVGVAGQSAISVTIVAASIDWQSKLFERGEIDMPAQWRAAWVVGMSAASILFVHVWQRRPRPRLMDVFLCATVMLMGIGYMKALGMADIWWGNPEEIVAAGGRDSYLWKTYSGEIVVHAIFTTLFVISVVAGVGERRATASRTLEASGKL